MSILIECFGFANNHFEIIESSNKHFGTSLFSQDHLLSRKCIPVNILEEWMLLHLQEKWIQKKKKRKETIAMTSPIRIFVQEFTSMAPVVPSL